ncbi:DUF6346 domain-containing protein [Micromonospora sp. DT43]|uniref:DUF6346 domain-containing protein n=1 Tax=Micromonospora sp. DT43 TaxID=3393440 RepID=UPI003CEBA4F8
MRPLFRRSAVGCHAALRSLPTRLSGGRERLGYWWHCAVTVRTNDGREVRTLVRHSVVTPDDRGRSIEFRQVCCGRGNIVACYCRFLGRWRASGASCGRIA